MRGVSGSGKSTLAKQIAKDIPNSVIFSTDDFFTVDGKYQFDPKLIGINHKKNQERTVKAMMNGVPCIIIDNTNTQYWEMRPYVDAAEKYGYEVEIRQPEDASFDEIMRRQKSRKDANKSLPPEIVRNMLNRFQYDATIEKIKNSLSPR